MILARRNRVVPPLRLLAAVFLATTPLPRPAAAQEAHAPPPETEQFARLVGDWEMRVWNRDPDGSWPDEPTTASWSWRSILGGHAVQDHWAAARPELGGAVAHGTNVRIYDPDAGHWWVSWTASDDRDLMELTARQEGEELRVYGRTDAGVPLRITFHGMTEDRFLWRMEIPSSADGSWLPISRMEGTRVDGAG